uniref:putative helicase mov-10-B.1 isoform X1 n=1 Tax=Scatophagus argus TaxID=75038 RepID=UPI001ED7FA46|nr:putative helicase mov-10-B.1 isoform X1 [Scatophagus argus]
MPLPVHQKDQMSFLYKQEEQSQMLPAVWPASARDTVPGSSGYQDGPHHTSVAEVQAQQARQKIEARKTVAKLFQQYRDQLISNKYEVTVTSDPVSTEEKICLTVYENKKVIHFTVKNSGVTAVYLTFWSAVLVKNIFTVRDCHGNNIKTINKHTLQPGETYEIKVHFHSLHAGFYEQLLVFNFETCQQFSDTFEIMRLLEVIHLTSLSEEPSQKATDSLCQSVLSNLKKGMSLLTSVIPLKKYGIPHGIKYSKEDVDLLGPLNWENYSQRFHMLLHLEEHQQKTNIEKYNQDNVPLFACKSTTDLVIMQIAGVSKSTVLKPSGVRVQVVPLVVTNFEPVHYYTGWLQHVEGELIYLQFDKDFLRCFKEGMRVRALFAINRISLRLQHRAAVLIYEHRLKEVLFPTGQHSVKHSHLHSLPGVEGNPEQCTAVHYIVAGTAKPAPYLVFGPPGTGKTVTLVEAIKQIVKTQNSCHILACAPSNSAADHLCEKILEKKIRGVFRLYAFSFPVRNISPKIKPHCNLDISNNNIILPPKKVLLRYKVMVTTLITAGRLVTAGINPSHFTYIFVDEAGQAIETECVIPLAGLMKPHTCQVVLAGDPKQLGPVITSTLAEESGLGLSLLERLMNNIDLYKSHDGFNNRFITKLLRNYRSHPAILKIPNELFYKGELQAYADKKRCSSFCKWEHLPKKGFPLIFHGVAGTDERDADSPSAYNMAEVEVIKEYLKSLIDHFHKNDMATIEPREIGIITPYRKQVEKIQNALKTDKDLKKENLENIVIGSVENFQGKEFSVILLSTVRSTPKLSASKQQFTLGFVDNEKRFNVALTRAKSLLIVIGDPRILKTDKIWNKFVNYCYKEGAYRGIAVSDEEEEEEEDTLNNVHSQNLWNHGIKSPHFRSVLYGLTMFDMITTQQDNIYFKCHSDRRHQREPASPRTVQVFVSGEEAETARGRLARFLKEELKKSRAQLISAKNGIRINSDPQFENGKLCLLVEECECLVNLKVENSGTKPVYFTYYTPLHWLKYFTLKDESKVTKTNPLCLHPGDSYEIQVIFHCTVVGFYPTTLAFEFRQDLQTSDAFYIVRFIEARCITALGRELAPTAPYKPRSLPAWIRKVDYKIVDGQRPEGLSKRELENAVMLKEYRMPAYMNSFIKSLEKPTFVSDKRRALLESPLSRSNYSEKFHLLLYLEEQQMEVDIKKYNIPNSEQEVAIMTRDPVNKKLLVLEVPGVSENRPSVLRGDALLAYPVGEKTIKYRGYVHSVQLNSVKLGFGPKLLDRFVDGMKFNIEFTISRLILRLQHRAAELAPQYRLEDVLFPAAPTSSQQTELPQLRLFDSKLEKNTEQYQAVQHIVAGSSKPAPYLLFGPPGTGKTVTLVEAIKQIEKNQASCHILACAPSNSAADLLCEKILDSMDPKDKPKVYRIYASSREPKSVPDGLKACSNLVGDCYFYPAKEKLMEYRIIVTTLLTAGRLVTGGIPAGHFTHVFVDEAGHAVETECLIPVAGLLHPESGQVVLAGDPKQLGPIIRSPFALKYGMGVSLLERLMKDFPLYQKNEGMFNNRFVTKLLHNYRSHPAILKIPNELFYDGELQVCADEILRNSYCYWEYLPRKGFPVIFHGVAGVDEREASSPSFFNVAEVEVLMDYVRKLLQTHGKRGLATISPEDIGIIAPYRKQVQKIRKALDKVGKELKIKEMGSLKVGSVEEFQGQERRVIMVSTVRSSPNYAEIDQQFNLGFVKNEKRFNVAVTRAKALLIVVGNPRVLNTDSTWARFIQYSKDEGGYTGFTEAEEDEDVVMRLAFLYISIDTKVETAESAIQQYLDPEWRSDL